jgi:hypothetical protein
MSFGGSPPPMTVPPMPQVAPQMMAATTKPPKKPNQPTAVGEALAANLAPGGNAPRRTLIGGGTA